MRIALVGYGRMGKAVEEVATQMGHQAFVGCDFSADVLVDFTAPKSVKKTALSLPPKSPPWVIGTTGWEKEEVLEIAQKKGLTLLYGSNFSVGMTIFSQLIQLSRSLTEGSYDIAGLDIHHEKKKDSPSGTARQLMEKVPGLTFQSIRSGHHMGTHQIFFDSMEDTIEITHRAKNRKGFARGAILAAEWLIGKEGIYTFENFVDRSLLCHFQESLPR